MEAIRYSNADRSKYFYIFYDEKDETVSRYIEKDSNPPELIALYQQIDSVLVLVIDNHDKPIPAKFIEVGMTAHDFYGMLVDKCQNNIDAHNFKMLGKIEIELFRTASKAIILKSRFDRIKELLEIAVSDSSTNRQRFDAEDGLRSLKLKYPIKELSEQQLVLEISRRSYSGEDVTEVIQAFINRINNSNDDPTLGYGYSR
ncbi:hypothetical protein CEW46_23885 [Bacillus cereus]|nr:hypothetical protein CEW46_23885 [Bacillus cereus]